MSEFSPASWIAILLALGGGLFVVFANRKGR